MPGELADDVLELRLREHDPARRAWLFAIHDRRAAVDIGQLLLRLDPDDPGLRQFAGHLAFEIAPEHRGHRHAARACLLIVLFARRHGFTELWLTAAPDNLASRRTIERLGAEYVDTVPIPEDSDMRDLGLHEVCRYRWHLAAAAGFTGA